MADIPKYDRTSDPQEHITAYTTALKWNDLDQHEIESILLKKFGQTLTKGALTWYSLLPEHLIDSFVMIKDSFIKAHVGDRKVQAREADILRISQAKSELLREFVIRFQKERTLLPAVPDDWAAEAFTKGLNPRSYDASRKLKESLLKFQATTWADVHNHYESKIKIEDDHLEFPTSTKGRYRDKNQDMFKSDFDMDRRSSKGHFWPYERTKRCGSKGFRSLDMFAPDRRTDRR
nr:uncharacterized protein LOC104100979 [Nicotiana tomentosiformis]